MRTAAETLSVIHALIMPYREKDSPDASDIFADLLNPETFPICHGNEENDCVVCGAGGLRGIGDAFFSSGEMFIEEPDLGGMPN